MNLVYKKNTHHHLYSDSLIGWSTPSKYVEWLDSWLKGDQVCFKFVWSPSTSCPGFKSTIARIQINWGRKIARLPSTKGKNCQAYISKGQETVKKINYSRQEISRLQVSRGQETARHQIKRGQEISRLQISRRQETARHQIKRGKEISRLQISRGQETVRHQMKWGQEISRLWIGRGQATTLDFKSTLTRAQSICGHHPLASNWCLRVKWDKYYLVQSDFYQHEGNFVKSTDMTSWN